MPPWLIPVAILYLALAIARFRWAIFVLIALLPTYVLRFNIGWLPSTWLEVMIWIVVGVWLIKTIVIPGAATRNPEKITGSRISRFAGFRDDIKKHWPLSLGIALLLIDGTISLFIAPDLHDAAGLWKAYIIEPIALFLVFITTFKKEDAPKIIFALSLTALVTSAFAIYQKFTGWGIPNPYWAAEETRRVTSVWGFPNAIGLFLAPMMPLFLSMSFRANRKTNVIASDQRERSNLIRLLRRFAPRNDKRDTPRNDKRDTPRNDKRDTPRNDIVVAIYYLLIILLSFLAIIFAKSTGALVGLAAALVITGVLYKKTRIITIVLTTLGVVLILTIPRLALVKQELLLQDYSGRIRRDMWAESVELLSEHPILGTGLSSYKEMIHRYRIDKWIEIFEYPHNIILNFWIELGALGVLAFVLIFYWIFKTARATPALLAVFTIILIHGLVDVPYFKNDLAIQFWLIAALCYNTLTYER